MADRDDHMVCAGVGYTLLSLPVDEGLELWGCRGRSWKPGIFTINCSEEAVRLASVLMTVGAGVGRQS